jgi:hypothetical protein
MKRYALAFCCVFLGITLVAGRTSGQQANQETRENNDTIRRRAEWFYHQRAYPLKQIPPGARLKALKQLEQMKQLQSTSNLTAASRALISTSWTQIGPEPINPIGTPFGGSPTVSGRVRAIAVDPTNPNVVYIGTAGGGVWKTTNGGSTWTPLTDTQASLAIGAIAIDPSNHNTIFVGTGEEVPIESPGQQGSNYYGAGILKSTDGGSTWELISAGGPFGPSECEGGAYIGALAVSPSNSQVALAALTFPGSAGCENASFSGIYRTSDGGTSWTPVLTGAAGTSVLFNPSNGNIAYAALGDFAGSLSNGVYVSKDGGATWSGDNGSSSNSLFVSGWITLAIAPSNPQVLYAGLTDYTTGSGNFGGLFVTGDGGANWFLLINTPDYCSPQCYYDNVIAVAPNNPNVVYLGGAYQYNAMPPAPASVAVVRSLNGGSSWSAVELGANGVNVHTDVHALTFSADSSKLYVGSDGGVWSTTNITSTVNWTGLNGTLATTTFYPGPSISPSDINSGIAGAQDNGADLYTGTLEWHSVTCGDGGYTAIDFNTPSTLYSACIFRQGPQKSTSGGTLGTWTAANTGINENDRAGFVPPMVIDPSNSQTLYYGTYLVYRTTNGAGQWTAISPSLTKTTSGFLSAIAVAPSNRNTVYAGSDDSYVTVTQTADAATPTWFLTNAPCPRAVTAIAVDPSNSNTVYVTYSGFTFGTDKTGHVFKTTDGGVTFTDISGNLPNIPVNSIVIDPDVANRIYIATDIGVFFTSNSGTTWTILGTGLPNTPVTGLAFHHATRILRAVTYGRSAWDISLPNSAVATSTTLASSLNPSTFGQSVTFTATVTATSGTPTGTVTFKDGTTTLGTGTLSGGKATFTTSTLAAGSHSITGVYGGDTNFAGSSSPAITQTVNRATSSTSLASSLNPSTFGAAVTFTATVTSTGGTPTGTVTFKDGTTTLGTGTLSGGKATFTTSTLAKGSHSIVAVYSGSVNYLGSTSPTLTQTVN